MASPIQLKNNAVGRLTSGVSGSATTLILVSGDGAKFPTLTGTQYFPATLIRASDSAVEIVKVTARSGDVLTVVRAQEGTSGLALLAGDRVELRFTAGTLADEIARVEAIADGAVADAAAAQADADAAAAAAAAAQDDADAAASAAAAAAAASLPKAGGTMTGDLTMGAGRVIVFEGTTDDAHETTLTAGEPTADRTVTMPDKTGTLAMLDDAVPAGTVIGFAGTVAPTGWLKCNGAAVSRTTYANLFAALVTAPGFTPQTFTVTIGASAVFTKVGHGFVGGERIRLSTTGVLPTGLDTVTDYYVIYLTADTFNLATSYFMADPLVDTSGAQSGTHSYQQSLYGLGDGSTTFNLPDFRGFFPRYADDGRGVDAGRMIGTEQTATYIRSRITPGGTVTVFQPDAQFTGGNMNASAAGAGLVATSYYAFRPQNVAHLPLIKW